MSAPYRQDNAPSAYLARSSGKVAGCGSTSVPGAMAPLIDHPPEGYTRHRAPSAPDERLSRTRGSPVGRLAGGPGRRGRPAIPSGAAPGTVVLSSWACPCFSPGWGRYQAFFLPGFGVHSFWRPGPWGLAMRPREADMAPGAARGGGAYRYPACGGKCRGSGPRRRPRPPARFWSCSKRVPALPGTELLRRRSAHPDADPTEGQRDRRLCWRPVRLSPVSAPSPCSTSSNDTRSHRHRPG
jgi:hypothetical protein